MLLIALSVYAVGVVSTLMWTLHVRSRMRVLKPDFHDFERDTIWQLLGLALLEPWFGARCVFTYVTTRRKT